MKKPPGKMGRDIGTILEKKAQCGLWNWLLSQWHAGRKRSGERQVGEEDKCKQNETAANKQKAGFQDEEQKMLKVPRVKDQV